MYSLAGGGNAEFQWYVNDRANSFTTDGNLHLKPTYTADVYSEAFLNSGHVEIPSNECSEGCEREGSPDSIINPIRSAYVSTKNSFSFKYGTLEIRAKMPLGDWLWPALWLYSTHEVYGRWPISGEIVSKYLSLPQSYDLSLLELRRTWPTVEEIKSYIMEKLMLE